MKKGIYYLSVCALLLGITSCGNSGKSANADSALNADTVAVAAVEDTAAVQAVEEPVNIDEALTLTVESKNLKYKPESSEKTGSVTVKVTNNSKSEIKGSEYEVTYDEDIEEWFETADDNGFRDVTKKRTVAGKDIAPGESVQIVLKAGEGCQDIKNPKIKALK